MSRRERLVGLFGLLALFAGIGLLMFLGQLDGCMTGTGGGSCPALADVNGTRYTISVARSYSDLAPNLSVYAPITRTNSGPHFAEMVTYRIGDLDPMAVLAAPASPTANEDAAAYRLLFGPNSEDAFPALCDYFAEEMKLADDHCRTAT